MTIITNDDIKSAPYTKIVTSGANKTFSVPLHKHTFFEFIIVFGGTVRNTVNGASKTLRKGSVQLLRPQDEHTTSARDHFYCNVYVIPKALQAICDCISPTLYDELLETPLLVDFTVSDFQLKQLEMRLNFFHNAENQDEHTLRAAHVAVVTELLNLWQQAQLHNSSNLPLWLNQLLRNLTTEKFLTMSVGDVIASTHYSHGHVCREFKKFFGVSLHDYLTEQKFSYAKSLLCSSNITIAEIAERLNYGSASNFVIAFKKRFGESPTKWRKNQS